MAVYQPNASSENRMEPDTPPTTLAGGEVFEELTARHEQEEVKLHIYIIRKSNGNKVYIDKDSFLIGRSSACDYVISDKPDISRKHATIIKEKNECYIRDEESSFGTFVDGRKLEANVKTKIGPGELIRLSGEEFKISYEEE